MIQFKKYLIVLVTVAFGLSSCDKDFEELNTNTVDPTSLNPQYVMNNAIIMTTYTDGSQTLGMLCYNFPIVQQVVTPFGSSLSGGNYNIVNTGNSGLVWSFFYQNVVKQITDVVAKTKGNDALSNLYHESRIWKAYVFMIISDTYGDVPYSEAGKGYLEEIISPKYDKQETIYKDILKELDEASAALSTSKPVNASDVLYAGNVVSWKKFGYSLMLRAAMRLSKADQTTAKTYVTKAIAGGLMASNADNAVLKHTSLYTNFISIHLGARERANFYIAKPFLDFLKNNNDPRLAAISFRYPGAKTGADQVLPIATTDPAKQVGMPIGYDDVSIATTFAANGVASLYDYSQINLNTVLSQTAPEYHVTYSETQLLLAEAVVRGWATGDAAALYNSAVTAHMKQMGDYGSAAVISDAAIATYLGAHPYDPAKALEVINTQYWVSSFMNGSETWANFRRSGFPALTKNPYPGSTITGNFIRRMPYPDSETLTNQANLTAAIAIQGANTLNTPVWWDK